MDIGDFVTSKNMPEWGIGKIVGVQDALKGTFKAFKKHILPNVR